MNTNIPGQCYRGPPNGTQMGPGPRPGPDLRNGNMAPGHAPPSATGSTFPAGAQMTRVEQFEDEKNRIIESCFGKKEPDGSMSESYITHIRILEDEDYPSIPAPPESPPQKKKPRVIMIAVRKSGRVRMHKGRENANGTFSIGKTWQLDDLTRVESFTNSIPQTSEQLQYKQNAGATGFLVTIQKPYYWQAATDKEKDFFIFSLIKIFRKYTGGKLPELVGFSARELDQLGGPASTQGGIQLRPQMNAAPDATARIPSQDPPPSRPPRADIPPPDTPSQKRLRSSQERESQTQERPLHSAVQQEHRVLHSAVSRDRAVRPTGSNDRMRVPGSFPSTESIPSQTSKPSLRPRRSGSPGSQTTLAYSATSGSRAPSENRNAPSNQYDSDHIAAQPTASGRSSSEQSRPNGVHPTQARFRTPSQQASESADERPRTANKEDGIPPALAIRNAKHRQPDSSSDYRSGSQTSNYAQTPRILSSESTNGEIRDESRPGRPQIRDYSAVGDSPYVKNRSASDVRSAKPSSHDTPIKQQPQPEIILPPVVNIAIKKDETSGPPASADFPPTPPPEPQQENQQDPEVHRPGLGPMIKKKSNAEIASKFRKAATAYNAFKPRAGSTADKVQDDKTSSGDGITGVFQAPSLLRGVSQDEARPSTSTTRVQTRPSTPEVKKEPPPVSMTTSPSKQQIPPTQDPSKLQDSTASVSPPMVTAPAASSKPPLPPQDERRKKRRSDHSAKYAKSLGINPSLLEGRTSEIEATLTDFGWGDEHSKTTFEDLESGIRKELARVEAGSWLGAVENNDDRTAAVGDMMDKVMAECEELDCLLTLYNVELGSLSEDVAYIEAQSQGLQVQTANQKLLHTELRNLLDTISISASQLKTLKDASLTKARGIQDVEITLSKLYSAMLTIDPKLRHHDTRPISPDQASLHRASSTGGGGTELSSMLAVREKKESYQIESLDFILRLKQYLNIKFKETEAETLDAIEKHRNSKTASPTQLDDRLRERPKRDLWIYSPLMLFAREIEPKEWEDLMKLYENSAKKPYHEEFRDNIFAWKRITRKPIGDEHEVLFTAQEKESDSLVGRKLTVKRSKTVRADGSSRISSGDRPRDGKFNAYEAFAHAVTEEARIIFIEQNFIVDIFHVSSLDTQDFADAVATDPETRQARDLLTKKPFDPDRRMARKVLAVMEEIFGFWSAEIQSLVDWAVKQDSLNAVGILFAMESQMAEIEETNQEFISQVLSRIHDRLATQFSRFIEDQIRGIEDTKVKIKKRKGVIAFMRTFPNFSIALENMLPPTRSLDHLPIRSMVDDAYQSVNKAMFESLKFIAKESPSAAHSQTVASGGDPEDKEALNHHILLIENMNHYIEEVPLRNNPVLEEWNFRARAEMQEHMDSYLSAVTRRPLGKLLDFVESTETLLKNNFPNSPPTAIAQRPSHSRQVAKKILSSYDSKEIKRGIETLRKRVEKHFGEGDHDGHGSSKELVGKVLKECEGRYLGVLERVGRLVRDVYSGELEVEWRREDVVGGFRR